ncbi:MAG: hypothetical protein NXH75_03220 [Halobacteriovoraceae bacterium]|nr:hypothetical protein [Halobacteriovoraceae bacterium]
MSSYAQNQFTLTGDGKLHYAPSEKPFDGRENARLARLSYAFRKFLNEQATEDLSPDENQVLKDQLVALVSAEMDRQNPSLLAEEVLKLSELYPNVLDQFKNEPSMRVQEFFGLSRNSPLGDSLNQNLPAYCDKYPALEKDAFEILMGKESSEELYFCSDFSGNNISLSMKDLFNHYENIDKSGFRTKQREYKNLLINKSISSILNLKNQFLGLYPELNNDLSEEFFHCANGAAKENMENDSLSQVVENHNSRRSVLEEEYKEIREELKKDFKRKNLFESLINGAHFKKYNETKKENKLKVQEAVREMRTKVSKACLKKHPRRGRLRTRCKRGQSGKILSEKAELEAKFSEEEEKLLNPLYLRVRENPLLFEREDDSNVFVSSTSHLKPSKFSKSLLSLPKSKAMVVEFQNLMEKNPDNFMGAFEKKLNEDSTFKANYENLIKAAEANQKVENEGKDAIKTFNEGMDNSAAKICESDGEKLQHFPPLTESIVQNALAEGSDKSKVLSIQMSQCQLMRENPLDEDRGWGMFAVGLGAIAIGTVAQVVPVIGNIGGGAMFVAGTAIVLGGGATLTYDSYLTQSDKEIKLNTNTVAMHSGWNDYSNVLESAVENSNARVNTYLSAATLPLDVAFVGLAARALKVKKLARLNITPEKTLDAFSSAKNNLDNFEIEGKFAEVIKSQKNKEIIEVFSNDPDTIFFLASPNRVSAGEDLAKVAKDPSVREFLEDLGHFIERAPENEVKAFFEVVETVSKNSNLSPAIKLQIAKEVQKGVKEQCL